MVEREKRNTNSFQEFFTTCEHILNYMISLLDLAEGDSILEPCSGQGAFIDKILELKLKINIDAFDLNIENIEFLNSKYNSKKINIKHLDFLLHSNLNKQYDRIIANPPYGAYQSKDKRNHLKSVYPDLYTKETYGMFLIHSLRMLKKDGRLVFIIPDTYLNLHMHKGLRARIINNYTIESITLFPSKFFPGVNFGYAGLSIISIVNKTPSPKYSFPVFNNLKSKLDFYEILNNSREKFCIGKLSYSEIKNNSSYAFLLPTEKLISKFLNSNLITVGDIADVVTGFYSGNDRHYLKRSSTVTRGITKYDIVPGELIYDVSNDISINGIQDKRYYIPIVKGGNRRFFKPTEWYMNWSTDAIYDYKVINKNKARFQNSSFYFKQGLAIPMVSSSNITAALIDNRLFDQSIVGVFPKEQYNYLLYYFLGFFNSEICNKIIRTINSSTNNSANYIKKIPALLPKDKMLFLINNEVFRIYNLAKNKLIENSDLLKLNELFNKVYTIENISSSPSVASTFEQQGDLFAGAL